MTARILMTRYLCFAAALAVLSACGDSSTSTTESTVALHSVTRGPLRISVSEAAELEAARETRIQSKIEGSATIISLVEEGAVVEKGQQLVELDVSSLVDRRATQAITVERARAALVNSQQNVEILEKELTAELAAAKSQVQIAEIDLEKFMGRPSTTDVSAEPSTSPGAPVSDPTREPRGTNRDMLGLLEEQVAGTRYAGLVQTVVDLLGSDALDYDMGELGQQVLVAIDEISLARQTLAIASDTKGHSERLYKKNYITRNQLDGDRLDFERQTSNVKIRWQDLELLINYTLLKTKIDLELKVNNARLTLEKTDASAAARREREKAELKSSEEEFKLAKGQLENLEEQIDNAIITAPTPGLIIYAELDRRGNEVVEEGMSVRDRQTLLLLPDVTEMQAELKIQESDIDKVRVGQRATIELDGVPGRVFEGRVKRVSPVADSGSRWSSNTLKQYKTWVSVDFDNAEGLLKPNMAARVEILVGLLPDAISVPLTAVRRQGAVHYVWKDTESGPVASLVKIGRNTLTEVEIKDGLEEGDRIHLAPPAGVLPPQFEQPKRAEADTPPPDPNEKAERAEAKKVTRESFQAKVIEKFPEHAAAIKKDGMKAMFRNEDIRNAIQGDTELSEMSQQLMQEMMRNRGQGGGGGRPGGGRPGGGGGGRDR